MSFGNVTIEQFGEGTLWVRPTGEGLLVSVHILICDAEKRVHTLWFGEPASGGGTGGWEEVDVENGTGTINYTANTFTLTIMINPEIPHLGNVSLGGSFELASPLDEYDESKQVIVNGGFDVSGSMFFGGAVEEFEFEHSPGGLGVSFGVPVTSFSDLQKVGYPFGSKEVMGQGTAWAGKYPVGLDMNYIQVANIDASSEFPMTPLGAGIGDFTGIYDGLGHCILGLEIAESAFHRGLFSTVMSPGAVRSLGLIELKINPQEAITLTGGVAGLLVASTIEECFVTGNIYGTVGVGGLVGQTSNMSFIKNSFVRGEVNGDEFVGGIVGIHQGFLERCYFAGWVPHLEELNDWHIYLDWIVKECRLNV